MTVSAHFEWRKYHKPLEPVVRSLVSANRWLRGIKTCRFPWYLTLVSANHASNNPVLISSLTCYLMTAFYCPLNASVYYINWNALKDHH